MAEINVPQARTEPDDLTVVQARQTAEVSAFQSRSIPSQSWSTMQALNFIMLHENDFRDPAVLADLIVSSIYEIIDSKLSQDALSVLYDESYDRRASIDLDGIDEDIYKNQRDPQLLRQFILELLVAMGLESELTDDISEVLSDEQLLRITDDAVKSARDKGAPSEVEEISEQIAVKLGLQFQAPDTVGQNLIIDQPYELDSTDSYVKMVVGQ